MTIEIQSGLWQVQTAIQISSASFSFVASTTMAFMIARSKNSANDTPRFTNTCNQRNRSAAIMSSPYLRIIFALSISDIFQSMAIWSGPFSISATDATPSTFWAIGNSYTCMSNAVIFHLGLTSTSIYTFLLSYFCLCKVKWKMTDETFQKDVEWKWHAFNFVYNVALFIIAITSNLVTSSPTGHGCSFGSLPPGCGVHPEIYGDCERSALFPSLLVYVATSTVCLVGITTCMAKICWSVIVSTSKNDLLEDKNTQNSLNINSINEGTPTSIRKNITETTPATKVHNIEILRTTARSNDKKNKKIQGCATDQEDEDRMQFHPPHPFNLRDHRTSILSRESRDTLSRKELVKLCKKQIMIQAVLYTLAFFMTNGFLWYNMVYLALSDHYDSSGYLFVSSICYPLGGVLNILVYTRPKVLYIRKENPRYSWFQAFKIVIKAGGVAPRINVETHEQLSELQFFYYAEEAPALASDDIISNQKQNESLSSGGLIRNFSSVDTPPQMLVDALSSGAISSSNSEVENSISSHMYEDFPQIQQQQIGTRLPTILSEVSGAASSDNSSTEENAD